MKRTGFTLIELLIVVLIIGILAGIALPQYYKAVTRAKFAEADVIIDAFKKNEAVYRSSHAWGSAGDEVDVWFTGSNAEGAIEMPGNCSTSAELGEICETDLFLYGANCAPSMCMIQIMPKFLAEGSFLAVGHNRANGWMSGAEGGDEKSEAEICRYLRDRHYVIYDGCGFSNGTQGSQEAQAEPVP